jgi:hypothetical protein
MKTPSPLPGCTLHPLSRADLPLALLVATAAVTPFAVLGQGGDWHTAMVAAFVVLGVPGAAIEAMVGVVRLAIRVERGGR